MDAAEADGNERVGARAVGLGARNECQVQWVAAAGACRHKVKGQGGPLERQAHPHLIRRRVTDQRLPFWELIHAGPEDAGERRRGGRGATPIAATAFRGADAAAVAQLPV